MKKLLTFLQKTGWVTAVVVLSLMISCGGVRKNKNKSDKKIDREIIPQIMIGKLPREVRETSGLLWLDNLIWTMNDSGGENILYGLDPKSGAVIRKVRIDHAENYDWETLSMNRVYVFIGDVGNNFGNRKDLRIYRLPKKELSGHGKHATAEVISFSWPDQTSFMPGLRNTPFDCEAMICLGDSLMLFTKDWANENTKAYMLLAQPGFQKAVLVDSLQAGVLVTGADLSPDGKTLILSAYHDFNPYLWVFTGFQGHDFFNGNKIRFSYPSYHDAQTEGVVFKGAHTILISAEESRKLDTRIYLFRLSQLE